MQTPRVPENEERRLKVLLELQLLDSPREPIYDNVTLLASEIFDVPISLVSIVDRERQWFKSRVGLEASETGRDISFCGHVVYTREPLVIKDALRDPRFSDNPLVTGPPRIRFYAGVPILLEEDLCIGTLCIIDSRPRDLSRDALERLERLRNIVEDLLRSLREATVDSLTGVFNRRMCERIGEKLLSGAARSSAPLSCVCIDIDHFKTVNDSYGHEAGDAVLREFGRFIHEQIRGQDHFFRLGGEEFALLMPNTDAAAAVQASERLRRGLRDLVVHTSGVRISITSSFGIAQYHPGHEDLTSLMRRADFALYLAKAGGRDCVVEADEALDLSMQRREKPAPLASHDVCLS